jgi:allantoin racemase
VPLGTLDIACDGGRSAVDIPVIGPSEAMLHIACMLGRRFGVMIYHDTLKPLLERIVTRYEMDDRIGACRSTGYDLPDLAGNRDAAKQNIIKNARLLVEEDDCDVVLPMGVSQCPLMISSKELSDAIGVPVVEGVGAPIRLAAMMADLGMFHSRRRWPKH